MLKLDRWSATHFALGGVWQLAMTFALGDRGMGSGLGTGSMFLSLVLMCLASWIAAEVMSTRWEGGRPLLLLRMLVLPVIGGSI